VKSIDTIIIGAGVGGLSAACYEAKSGKQVLIIEQNSAVGGKAAPETKHGLTIDPGPSIIILKWIYERFFEDMDRDITDYITFKKLSHMIDLEYQSTVWSIPCGDVAFLEYIKSEFPEDYNGFVWLVEACDQLYDKVTSSIYKRQYSSLFDFTNLPTSHNHNSIQLLLPFASLVETKFKHPAIKGLLYDFLTYSGHTKHQPSPTSWFILYTMIREGVYYPKSGINMIPKALGNIATELGVDIHTSEKVTALLETNSGYTVTTTKSTYTCSNLIANVDPIITGKLLGKSSKKVKASFSYATLTYSYSGTITKGYHTLHIPLNYKESYHNLFSHQQTSDDDFVYYLNHPRVSDDTTDPYLFVVAPVSTIEPRTGWKSVLKSLDTQVRKHLEKDAITDLTLIDSKSPEDFAQRDSNPEGSLFGSGYSWFGLLPQPLTNRNNTIIHVGGAVQPGAGLPMVLLSGKFASQML
jgi:phytoene dehydrogenase-like protein